MEDAAEHAGHGATAPWFTILGYRVGAGALIVATTIALCLVPMLLDLAISAGHRAFDYVAADAFYYLTVSRNIVEHGSISFDLEHVTNGFHPLWQYTLAGIYGVGRIIGLAPHHIVTATVCVCGALLALSVYLLAQAMRRAGGQISPLLPLLPVGVYSLLLSVCYVYLGDAGLAVQRGAEGTPILYGTLWSYANGMESSVLVACYAALVCYYVTRPIHESDRHAVVFGGLLALFTFARLDHALMAVVVLALLFVRALVLRERRAWRTAFLISVPFVAALIIYLVLNRWYFGSAMPVSGKLKAGFSLLAAGNMRALVDLPGMIGPDRKWLYLAFRLAQILVPMVFALVYLATAVRVERHATGVIFSLRRRDRYEHALLATALGVLALGLYDFLFVEYGNQGHWYLPVSTLFVSLAVLRWLQAVSWIAGALGHRRRLALLATVLVGLSTWYFLELHRTADYHAQYRDFYFRIAPGVRAHYGEAVPKLFAMDDGIVAFSLGFPAMSGTGLTGDVAMIPHVKARTTGDLAVARGYRHFTSLVYYNMGRFAADTRSESLGRWMKAPFRLADPARYIFTVDYREPRGAFAIIKVEPRP